MIRVLLVSLLVTVTSQVSAQRQVDNALPLISAHRGASRVAPENTKVSFFKAIESGADFIEIDVRTTLDGEPVIVHDKSLKRTTGVDALVNETNYTTIGRASAGSWFGKDFIGEKVPTLEEICVLVSSENKRRDKDVMMYVDCKDIDAAKVVALLKKYDLFDSAVFYGDVKTLAAIKEHSASARLMPAFPGFENVDDLLASVKPYAFDVPFKKLNHATVAYIHSKGIKVFSDLLGKDDHPDAYRKAISFDVDLIQTDDVEAVLNTYKGLDNHAR
jgi:glycerophosphoryl diester phosphodiesterase